jgi:vancomycin resistance protein YoaR
MGKIFPNIYVADINIGGLTPSAAMDLLSAHTVVPEKLLITDKQKVVELKMTDFDVKYNYFESAQRAYNLTRTDNFIMDSFVRLKLIFRPQRLGLMVNLDESKMLMSFFKKLKDTTVDPINPSISLVDGIVHIEKGIPGSKFDSVKLRSLIGRQLAFMDDANIEIPINFVDTTLTDYEIASAAARTQKYIGKTITFKFESKTYTLTDQDIIHYLDLKGGYDNSAFDSLITKISADINTDPQIPKFEFDGTRVTEFAPAKNGVSVDTIILKTKLISILSDLEKGNETETAFEIPVKTLKPSVSTDQVNNLGIKELIGSATTTYFHSIPGRVFNVNLAASRINGVLIPPGATFSFNQTLGDVSKFTGYKEAYIISGGHTILGDGGGVCQVSTTLFRAALNAGLPIDQRSAHAYRVGYYEQNSPPGLDATVYSPSPDFKFTNNTDNYILIQTKSDPKNYVLTFDLYGTSDGRRSVITKPVISNYSPPPPTVYQDDPTLPSGVLKQIDYGAAGAKVIFSYTVTKNGVTTFSKTFISNYQPWAAVYLRGTKI